MSAKKPVQKKHQLTRSQVLYVREWIYALRKNRLVRFSVLWLSAYLVLMSFFFNTILKNYSYIEIFPRELVIPTLMHAVTALIIALTIFWLSWLKSLSAKLIVAIILALLMIGYDTNLQAVSGAIRAFIPGLTDTDPMPLVSFIYLILLFVLAIFIGKGLERVIGSIKRVQPRDIELGILVLVAYLFIVPAISVAKILPTMIRETGVQAPEFTTNSTQNVASEKPDIYYIVLDRYTNADVLKKQFNHDNSNFTDFLRDNDFVVNDNAYSNYPYTTMSVSSTMNAQYTNHLVAPFKDSKIQNRTLYHHLIQQSSVVKSLKKEGYQYYAIGSWYGASYKNPLANIDYMYQQQLTVFGVNKRLRGIEAIEFGKSPYFRFTQVPNIKWWPVKYATEDHISGVRQQLNILDDLATKEKPGGRFIFAHILVPHDPFVFNGDGSLSLNAGTDSSGEPVKQKYVGQVEFINSQMKELVAKIQKQSNDKAVIIFNADEGPYPQFLNDTFKKPQSADPATIDTITTSEDMRGWSDDYFKMKFGILQAVHIPKATEDDLAHLSSVNVFRIVLNRYAGHSLGYLPNCHFGLTNGSQNEYNYADVTARFVQYPDNQCGQLQSLPKK